jgi:hypothetical protein
MLRWCLKNLDKVKVEVNIVLTFLNPNFVFQFRSNCFNVLDLTNLQEHVKQAFLALYNEAI